MQNHAVRILGEVPVADDSLVSICRLAIQAIENSSEDRLSTTQMAFQSVCSVRQLYRAFESVMESRPAEFERNLRLLMVRRDIAITMAEEERISQIASDHGFSNFARFRAYYEEYFMESPEETKRRMRAALDRSFERIRDARKSAIS